jgi:hypothetical protein
MTPDLERADAVRQQPPAGLHVFKATPMQTTVERCTDFAAASHAIVGICGRCTALDDAALQSVVLKTLRRTIYPDLTISAGPGRA